MWHLKFDDVVALVPCSRVKILVNISFLLFKIDPCPAVGCIVLKYYILIIRDATIVIKVLIFLNNRAI